MIPIKLRQTIHKKIRRLERRCAGKRGQRFYQIALVATTRRTDLLAIRSPKPLKRMLEVSAMPYVVIFKV